MEKVWRLHSAPMTFGHARRAPRRRWTAGLVSALALVLGLALTAPIEAAPNRAKRKKTAAKRVDGTKKPSPKASGRRADKRVSRIDRMWVVGAPVLDEKRSLAGLYAWVEDRALQFAARPRRNRREALRLRVRGTRPLNTSKLGDFRVISRESNSSVLIEARVKGPVARGKIRCAGDVTLTDASTSSGRRLPLFVGPLARIAASSVVIGRF